MSKRHFILGGITGFTLACLMNGNPTKEEITPLARYDVTGDGVADYIVGVGEGISPRSLHVGYIDGHKVAPVPNLNESGAIQTKYISEGDIREIVQISLPWIKEGSPQWFTSRAFNVSPTRDGRMLELSVSDGTLDGLSFDQRIAAWPNPNYSK